MRVVSGMQPTGTPHLGNYFGAFANWIKLQNEGHECFFFIADLHSLTISQDRDKLKKNILELCATYLAVGLDPNKSVLFIQSDVPAHTQLSWILSCLAPMGLMERMIQFKEKSEKHTATLGLLSYPVLQAADVLIYKADIVPVGVDQAQHLELSRDLARKFNNMYKEIFKEPQTLHDKTVKVVGLDGKSKMSKSYNNYIGLTEEKEDVWAKLAPAVTDPSRIKKSDPGNPNICNIYYLHKILSNNQDIEWSESGCKSGSIGCLDCKKRLFENLEKLISPIREKYKDLISRPKYVIEIFKDGAEKANNIANNTLKEVYELMGL